MNDRAGPGCGSQDARGCDVTPTSRILVRMHNPSCVQESVVENERCLKRTSLGDRVIHNLGLIHAVGMVDGIPRAASFFFGVHSWLVKVLGQFSIIYFRGLGLRIGVRLWVSVRVGVRVWVRVRVRVRVMVSVVLWSEKV